MNSTTEHAASSHPNQVAGGFPFRLAIRQIRRLLDAFRNEYDGELIVAIDEATRDAHLEFLIPHHYRLRISAASMN